MLIKFHKYQGTGNDFVMLDNLSGEYDNLTVDQIVKLCDRKFGIGADGLIKLNSHDKYDFEVDYYNADGSKSFCGNGARCSVEFARTLGINVTSTDFRGIDGLHNARVESDGLIHLEMSHISAIEEKKLGFVLHTGSPHFVHFTPDLKEVDVVEFGRKIRYSDEFNKEGINVNVVQIIDDNTLSIATYERGVEDETLSCGTGATACALAFAEQNNRVGYTCITVHVKGGTLKVAFDVSKEGKFSNVRLIGPAQFVFKGEIDA